MDLAIPTLPFTWLWPALALPGIYEASHWEDSWTKSCNNVEYHRCMQQRSQISVSAN